MKIIKKINDKIIDFKSSHFDYSIDGIKLKKFKDIHKNNRCFIIGNGPSLSIDDLNKLYVNNEITFAFNRIFLIFSETKWRPTYYLSQDEKIFVQSIDDIKKITVQGIFIPRELEWNNHIDIKSIPNAYFFHMKTCFESSFPPFSDNIPKGIYNSNTVAFSAIQLAVYMGFKEIYLLGIDHHFKESINKEGKIVIDHSAKDYFCDEYNKNKKDLYIPNPSKSTLAFYSAKFFAESHNVSIINATRGGRLELFPRIVFDDLFEG